MKFNFKKISAVVAGVLMTGMTLGVAHAANYPEPLVVDGQANAAIVYGSNAASTDEAAASDLMADLDDYADSVSSGSSSTSLGDDSLNLGDLTGDIFLGENFGVTLYDDDLDLLRSRDVGGEDYDQTLVIKDGNTIDFDKLGDADNYQANEDYAEEERPVLHVGMEDDSPLWEYELEFDNTLDFTENGEGGEEIVLAGKRWTIAPDMEDGAGEDLRLWASSVTTELEYDSSTTVEVNGNEYTMGITGATEDPREITLSIDGEKETLGEGETMTVDDDDFYVNNIYMDTFGEVDSVNAEIFAGADELVISEGNSFTGNEVELNEETVDSIKGYYIADTDLTDVGAIKMEFTPSALEYDSEDFDEFDDAAYKEYSFLEIGESIKDPVLGTVGFQFASGIVQSENEDDMEFADVEEIKEVGESVNLGVSGDTAVDLTFTNMGGDEYSVNLLEDESTDILTDFTTLSRDNRRDSKFILNIDGSEDTHTHIAEIDSVDLDDSDNVESVTFSYGGETTKVDAGETLRRSADDLVVTAGTEGSGEFAIEHSNGTDYSGALDSIYAANDVMVNISAVVNNANDLHTAPQDIVLTENDENTVSISVEDTSDTQGDEDPEYEVTTTVKEDEEGEYGYHLTSFGSYIEAEIEDNSWVEMSTAGDEKVKYKLLVGSAEESEDDDGEDTVGIGDILVTDSEVSSVDDKNLVVVGGSCINTAAAELLGVPEETCGEDFTDATGVGSGEALIKGYEDSDLTSEFAVLVAGYEAGDTTDAAKYLMNEKPDTSEELKVTSATEATVVSA